MSEPVNELGFAKICPTCGSGFSSAQEICPKDNTELKFNSEDPFLGEKVGGRYKLTALIGFGSWGTVYKAIDEELGRLVAVKILHAHLAIDAMQVKRFRREVESVCILNHPNISIVYDCSTIGRSQPCVIMEYLDGTTLDATLDRDRQISVKRSVNIATQVCAALSAAHAKGIVHRDIKPGNIMLLAGDVVKVLDFGLAKVASDGKDRLSGTGDVCGTVQYMSPEQCKGLELDGRSDIYSLGLTLYEAVTGSPACSGTTPYECIIQHLQEPLPPFERARPDLFIPPSLQAIVDKAVAKNRDNRFQEASDFGDALASFSTSNSFGTQSGPKKSLSTQSMIVAACLIFACAAIGLVAYNLSQPHKAPVVAAPPATNSHLPVLNPNGSAEPKIDESKRAPNIESPHSDMTKTPSADRTKNTENTRSTTSEPPVHLTNSHPALERKTNSDVNKHHREVGTINGVSTPTKKSGHLVSQTPSHHHATNVTSTKPVLLNDHLPSPPDPSRNTKSQPASAVPKPPVMQAEPPLFDNRFGPKPGL